MSEYAPSGNPGMDAEIIARANKAIAERERIADSLRGFVIHQDKQLVQRDERIAQLEAALSDLIDDDQCDFDHHGCCQTHNLGNPCEMERARALLAETELEVRE